MSITSNNIEVREIIHQVVNDPDYKEVSHVPLISWHQLGLIFIAYAGPSNRPLDFVNLHLWQSLEGRTGHRFNACSSI